MLVRHVITVTVSSSAKDEGPPSAPETEDGLLWAGATMEVHLVPLSDFGVLKTYRLRD